MKVMEIHRLMSSITFDGNIVPPSQCGLEATYSHAVWWARRNKSRDWPCKRSPHHKLYIGAYSHTYILYSLHVY